MDMIIVARITEEEWKALDEVASPPDDLQGKPYPNEHAYRIHPPARYKRFRRQNNKFGQGVDAIWGVRKDNDKVELQAIRFKTSKFPTAASARKWLKDHDYSGGRFEPAAKIESLIDPLDATDAAPEDALGIPDQDASLETQLSDAAAETARAEGASADNTEWKDKATVEAEVKKNALRWSPPLQDSRLVVGKTDEDMDAAAGSGTISGYASAFNVVDLVGDVVKPGAFKKTIREHKGTPIPLMARHFAYGGDILDAIGYIKSLKEDKYGLQFDAEYFDGEFSQQVRKKIAEMREKNMDVGTSIGYRLLKSGESTVDDKPVKELTEIALGEVTVTLKPCNLGAYVAEAKTETKDVEYIPVAIPTNCEPDSLDFALGDGASRIYEQVGKDAACRAADAMVVLAGKIRDQIAPEPQDTGKDVGSTGGETAAATTETADQHSDAEKVEEARRAAARMKAKLGVALFE